MIEITVRTDKEESYHKVSPEHTTVEQIKQLVLGSSFDGFSLKWEGKVLDDTDTLSKCGIATDVTMSLQPRHRAGGKGSGGGASKPKEGVAAGRRALTAIMATRKMQAGADASEGAEGSNQAVGGAASAADARRQTTTTTTCDFIEVYPGVYRGGGGGVPTCDFYRGGASHYSVESIKE